MEIDSCVEPTRSEDGIMWSYIRSNMYASVWENCCLIRDICVGYTDYS